MVVLARTASPTPGMTPRTFAQPPPNPISRVHARQVGIPGAWEREARTSFGPGLLSLGSLLGIQRSLTMRSLAVDVTAVDGDRDHEHRFYDGWGLIITSFLSCLSGDIRVQPVTRCDAVRR